MTPTLAAAAAPLVQPVTFSFVALSAVLALVFLVGFWWALGYLFESSGPFLASTGVLLMFASLAMTFHGVPSLSIVPGADQTRVPELVSERYRLESVTPISDPAGRGELCGTVSTRSPVYTGVVDGQQVDFRVGVPDCDAESPVVEIIVVAAPGLGMSAHDLERTVGDAW